MENYVRFNNAASPPNSRSNSRNGSFRRQHHEEESPASSEPPSPQLPTLRENGNSRATSWIAAASSNIWRRIHTPAPMPYESQYLTLIPLSDARLRPRRTKLIVSSLLLLAVIAVVGVFLLVPRGVTVGSIDVHSTKMTFNGTTLTYRIILQADVPIYNPNYLKVSVLGNVSVSFFDAEAGWSPLGPVTLSARQEPAMLAVKVDASNLPQKYTQVVYTHCFNFPRKLIFFLLGTFQATYLGYTTTLPSIDTYFMLDCSGAKKAPSTVQRHYSGHPIAPAAAKGSSLTAAATMQHLSLLVEESAGNSGSVHNAAAVAAAVVEPAEDIGWGQAGDWQAGDLHDWELEVAGTVLAHPSSSSSSSSSERWHGDSSSSINGWTGARGALIRQWWQHWQQPLQQ